MLDSFYHMTLKYFVIAFFDVKTSKFCHKYATLLWVSFPNVTCSRESVNHQCFINFNA